MAPSPLRLEPMNSEHGSSQSLPPSPRPLERYAVPEIPRWEDLRLAQPSSATPSGMDRSSYAMMSSNSSNGNGSYTTDPALLNDRSWDQLHRQHAELEAMRRQQQMVYELERARMRDRASRHEQMQREDSRAESSTSPSRAAARKVPQHKVYLINCKHCDLFLTDRGMKAVLLLKPHITLYSTDAVPTNCSPVYPSHSFFGGFTQNEPPVERTCDCLTQSLGCHGCGATVGYNIVAPCARCTSNVAKHQRGSNGHRTVLHCSEIRVRERRYVPGEPGIRAAPIPADLWPLLEMETAIGEASGLPSTSSSTSDLTVVDTSMEPIDKLMPSSPASVASSSLTDTNLDQQRRAVAARKEAIRLQLQAASASSGRIILRGESVFWSDLVGGGERTEPFDADLMLDLPVAGR